MAHFLFAGFLAHATWKILNGSLDVEDLGRDLSGLFFRAVGIIVGLIYLSLSYAIFQILTGKGTESSDQSTKIWIAQILAQPYGKWIVFLVATMVVVIGVYQFHTVYTASFGYNFDFERMGKKEQESLRLLGRIGIGAWGIVYFMMGFLFYQAAMYGNAKQAGGLGDALSALAGQPYGAWVLGIMALGLIIYGLYLLILSYYHES